MDVKIYEDKIKKALKDIETHKEKIKSLNMKIREYELQIEKERSQKITDIIKKKYKVIDENALNDLDKILNGNSNSSEKI